MVFFNKPVSGPDSGAGGGVFPWTQIATCRNRAGATIAKGEVIMLAFGAGNHQATEIATNDSNSYRPGYSNDTIWNTIVDPQSNLVTAPGPGSRTGGIFGVALEDVVDNGIGSFQFFGLVEQCFVIDAASGDGAVPGQPLAVGVVANNALSCHVATNALMVGFYCDAADATLTNRALKRVFLTNGLGLTLNGIMSGAGGAAIT